MAVRDAEVLRGKHSDDIEESLEKFCKYEEEDDDDDHDETSAPLIEMTRDKDSIRNKKSKRMTRKQLEKKNEMDSTSLLAGLSKQTVLNQIIVDIINIVTTAEKNVLISNVENNNKTDDNNNNVNVNDPLSVLHNSNYDIDRRLDLA